MTLRDAEVGVIQSYEEPSAWPKNLELIGFTYTRLGGFLGGVPQGRERADVEKLKEWLAKQTSYSRQPYEQLGKVLESEGYPAEASEIRYAGREAERAAAHGGTWMWMTMLKWLIGYGYRNWYSILWAMLFVILGALIFRKTEEARQNGMPYGFAYSFDTLVPIIRLREKHYSIDLKGWQRYYFYFHKTLGYVLASFIIAGLSGMTR